MGRYCEHMVGCEHCQSICGIEIEEFDAPYCEKHMDLYSDEELDNI